MKLATVLLILLIPAFVFAENVTFKLGGFIPDGKSDIWEVNQSETYFKVSDLAGFYASGEADLFMGKYFNFAFELGYTEKDTITEDKDFVYPDDAPILHTISLRMVPLQGNIKILPLGRDRKIIPYFGGGIGLYFWRYWEYGDFITNRYTEPEIITGSFLSTGADIGYQAMFGMMVPFGYHYSANGELKYVRVHGNLGSDFDPTFEPIDLSGLYVTFGISYWF
jgi:hypothetical protein